MAEAPVDAAAAELFQQQFATAFAAPTVDINAGYVLISGMIVFFMQVRYHCARTEWCCQPPCACRRSACPAPHRPDSAC